MTEKEIELAKLDQLREIRTKKIKVRTIQLMRACRLSNRLYLLDIWNPHRLLRILPHDWHGGTGPTYELNSLTSKSANIREGNTFLSIIG